MVSRVDGIEVKNLPVSVFDPFIGLVASYVETLATQGRKICQYDVPVDAQSLIESLPIKVGENAFSGLIMRKNTFLELGNPDMGSCAFPLWSNDLSLVNDGRVTLIGPNIQDSEGVSLPFGQVVLVAGEKLGKADQETLELKQYASNLIEGYMIRSAPGKVWSRISREVADKGFDFEMLGKALVAIFKQQIPHVESVEIIFISSCKDDVEKLESIAARARTLGNDLVKETWVDRGFDPDSCIEHDCSTCHEQTDCDDIRDVVQLQQQAKRERKAEQKRIKGEQDAEFSEEPKRVVRKFRR